MNTADILKLIDAEIVQLQNARALLAGTGKKRPGRPKSTSVSTVTPKKKRKKRHLTPEGRARIAAAVKARWAAQKRGTK